MESIPLVATPQVSEAPSRDPLFPHRDMDQYVEDLGDLRLYYESPRLQALVAPAWIEVEHPRSCDGGAIGFSIGRIEPGSMALRRAPAGGALAITWREHGEVRSVTFSLDRPGPLRSLARYRWALLVLLVAAAAAALARRRAVRAWEGLGPGGVATWRAGQVDERGWIAPADGSAAVPAALTGVAPGASVVFSTAPGARPWGYRSHGEAGAAAVIIGSRAEILARYGADARGALFAASLAAVAAGAVLLALARAP
jgi:hypothetical protein